MEDAREVGALVCVCVCVCWGLAGGWLRWETGIRTSTSPLYRAACVCLALGPPLSKPQGRPPSERANTDPFHEQLNKLCENKGCDVVIIRSDFINKIHALNERGLNRLRSSAPPNPRLLTPTVSLPL